MNPTLWCFNSSHLDTCKGIIKLLCHRSHICHSAWEADFLAMVNNLSYWRDNCCCTTKTTFCKILIYKRAIIIAEAQEANYQQALSGIACNLVSMAIYLSRNRDFNKSDIASQMNQAKIAVHENISAITPEELAKITCMSYSKFRKIFKEYTGFAPSQYIQEVRITMAKELLTNTSKSIKEIAIELGYDNKDYFFTVFKKVTGSTPITYRRHTQGEDLK